MDGNVVERVLAHKIHKLGIPCIRVVLRAVGRIVYRRTHKFQSKFFGKCLNSRPCCRSRLRSHICLILEVRLVETEQIFRLWMRFAITADVVGIVVGIPTHRNKLEIGIRQVLDVVVRHVAPRVKP